MSPIHRMKSAQWRSCAHRLLRKTEFQSEFYNQTDFILPSCFMAFCEHMWGLKTLLSSAPFARIRWKGVLHRNKGVSQERIECWNKNVGIQQRKNVLEDGEGESWKRSSAADSMIASSPGRGRAGCGCPCLQGNVEVAVWRFNVFRRASAWVGDSTEKMEVINNAAVTKTKKRKKSSQTGNGTKVHEAVRLRALFREGKYWDYRRPKGLKTPLSGGYMG